VLSLAATGVFMKNQMPDLSFDQQVQLISIAAADDSTYLQVVSDHPLGICGLVPDGPLESEYPLGRAPNGDWALKQLRKDWYNIFGSFSFYQDMTPPANTHIAMNLRGQDKIVDGVIVRFDEGLREKIEALAECPQHFGILEIYRPGNSDLAKLMRANPERVVRAKVAFGAVPIRTGKDSHEISGYEVDGLFYLRPYSELIGWQHIYNNGMLAKPIRQKEQVYFFEHRGEEGEIKDLGQFAFMDAKTGGFFVYRQVDEETVAPQGHHLNMLTLKPNTHILESFFHGRVYSVDTNVRIIACDSLSFSVLAGLVHSLVTSKDVGSPNVHEFPNVHLELRMTTSNTEALSLLQSLQLQWKTLGYDSQFNEHLVEGSIGLNGARAVLANAAKK